MKTTWCRTHDACTACGLTTRKHVGRGLCEPCYWKIWKAKNEDRIREYQRRRYLELGGPDKKYRELYRFGGKRIAVLERDGHRCTACGTENSLAVHHKDGNGRRNPTPNNDIANLVTLCGACHIAAHNFFMKERRGYVAVEGWSPKYGLAACRMCNKSTRRHKGNGLCLYCHNKAIRAGQQLCQRKLVIE